MVPPPISSSSSLSLSSSSLSSSSAAAAATVEAQTAKCVSESSTTVEVHSNSNSEAKEKGSDKMITNGTAAAATTAVAAAAVGSSEEPLVFVTTTTSSSSSQSQSQSQKRRTVVTTKRKEALLVQARSERTRWLRDVSCPYDRRKLLQLMDHKNAAAVDSQQPTTAAVGTITADTEDTGFEQLQKSLVCSKRYLSNATSVLAELYGITTRAESGNTSDSDNDDGDADGNGDGDDDGRRSSTAAAADDDDNTKLRNRKYPLSVEEVSDRVEQLAKSYWLEGKEEVGENGTDQANQISTGDFHKAVADDNKNSTEGGIENHTKSESDGKNTSPDRHDDYDDYDDNKKYEDLLTAYNEFIDTMVFPESAVTVQGMKNFTCQFVNTAATKKNNTTTNDDDDPGKNQDVMLRSMSSALNNHLRSSYESLPFTRSAIDGSSSKSGGGGGSDPNWDRRCLESFLYGKVKDAVDSILDDVTSSSSNNPFSMTQKQFNERLDELQFLQPSHLEIACLDDAGDDDDDKYSNNTDVTTNQSESSYKLTLEIILHEPIIALRSIEAFYSPYEKLQRVLDVFRGVNVALTKMSKSMPSADDILPTMILVVVKAAASATNVKTSSKMRRKKCTNRPRSPLKHILRDLHFVETFALPEYLRGEAGYAFTNLYSAVKFLEDVDLEVHQDDDGDKSSSANCLSISADELRRNLERSRASATKKNLKRENTSDSNITKGGPQEHKLSKGLISRGVEDLLGNNNGRKPSVPPREISVGEVRAARLRGDIVDLEWALRRQGGKQEASATMKIEQRHHIRGTNHGSISFSPSTKSKITATTQSQRYTFFGTRPENVKLSDLPKLLDEYRRLVLTTEDLLGEHHRANNRLQSERKRARDEKHRRNLGEHALLR